MTDRIRRLGAVAALFASTLATAGALRRGRHRRNVRRSGRPSCSGRTPHDRVFPHMERVFAGSTVRKGRHVRPLPAGRPLPVAAATVDASIRRQNVAGLLVLQHGRVRPERYARGLRPRGRWTSFSSAKSVTSMLVGAALRDGAIRSVDDPVTRYLPQLGEAPMTG